MGAARAWARQGERRGPGGTVRAGRRRKPAESLAADLIALAERFNRATDGSLVAPGQYAEVVIKRR